MTQKDPVATANAALERGMAALSAKQIDVARQAFEESLIYVPDNHIALTNLAALAAKQGDLEHAEAFLARVPEAYSTADTLFDLARLRQSQQKYSLARESYHAALLKDGSSIKVKKSYAALEQRLGFSDHATVLYRDVIQQDPSDKKAVMAYATLIWPEAPDEAISLLSQLLDETSDLAGKQEILFILILYKEVAERDRRGQAKYHATSIEDSKCANTQRELDELRRISGSILAQDPVNVAALMSHACVQYALDNIDASQACFSKLEQIQPNHIGSTVKLDADFLTDLANANVEEITAGFPGLNHVTQSACGGEPVILVSSDYEYFDHYGRYLIASINQRMPSTFVHVHLMDADERGLENAVAWCRRMTSLTCAITSETTGLGADEEDTACYYHAVRFVRYAQLRSTYQGPLWMIDADALAHGDARPMLQWSANWDVAMRLRPGRLQPWNTVSAGLVGMAPTPAATAFFTRTAAYIAHFWKKGCLTWGIDQLALLASIKGSNTARLRFVDSLEQDVEICSDGIFWFLSGPNKALFPSLRQEPETILSRLNERERRYAKEYMRYTS